MSWSGSLVSDVAVTAITAPGAIVVADASTLDVAGRAVTVPAPAAAPDSTLNKAYIDSYQGPVGADGPTGSGGPAAGVFQLSVVPVTGAPTGTGFTTNITSYVRSSYREGRLLRIKLNATANYASGTPTAATVVLPFPSNVNISPTSAVGTLNTVTYLSAIVPGTASSNFSVVTAVTAPLTIDNTGKQVTMAYSFSASGGYTGLIYMDMEVVLTVA
jgi:hypothetical protein